MTHRSVHKSDVEGVYRVPPLQPSMFDDLEGGRFVEDGVRLLAGKVDREPRFKTLFNALQSKPELKSRVVKILERVQDDEDVFKVTLDTIAYSRSRDEDAFGFPEFTRTIKHLEDCMEEGFLPLRRMKDLLEVGLVFTDFNHRTLDEETLQMEKNWIRGGEKALEDRVDISIIPRDALIEEVRKLGVESVSIGGANTPIGNAPDNVLMGVYASRIRSHRALERKTARGLASGMW